MSENKVRPHHLQRRAMLYVRQSSSYQVAHNKESRRLQYAMEPRLRSLGWQEVETIDEDLGRSAATTTGRTGFQYLVAEVCLGKVGAVAAREVSRFARNNRDWHQLIELCSLVDTLLVDHEMVYDPRQGNDRLLLGLKGTLSEYELDLLRQRSLEARRQKAARGELLTIAPVGYIRTRDDRLEKDPDVRVQHAVKLVFEKFLELGTARQTLLWFVGQGLALPAVRHGLTGWETRWKRPGYHSVLAILRNPTYAGAYAYGKTCARAQVRDGALHQSRVSKGLEDYSVLLRDRHEGYISWDTFARIRAMTGTNAQSWPGSGAPKTGPALLAGLLRCRRCGRVLMVNYTGAAHDVLRYCCRRASIDMGEERCFSVGGSRIDEAISREILRIVEPAAVDAAIRAVTAESQKSRDLVDALLLEVKAARYEAERARRQFDAVDPENRLVADELERRWNTALTRAQEVESRVTEEEVRLTSAASIQTPPFEGKLASLAADLGRAWHSPETDVRVKKRIIRALVEQIVVDLDHEASEVVLIVHWKGGEHSMLRVRRRRTGETRYHTSRDIVEAVRVLARVSTDDVIAGVLNRNDRHTGRGNRWTKERVTSLRSHHEIPRYTPEAQREAGWMKLGEAAGYLKVGEKPLRRAVEQALIQAEHPLPVGPWVFSRQTLDEPRVRAIVEGMHHGSRPSGDQTTQLALDISST